jgi:hypothetical protein
MNPQHTENSKKLKQELHELKINSSKELFGVANTSNSQAPPQKFQIFDSHDNLGEDLKVLIQFTESAKQLLQYKKETEYCVEKSFVWLPIKNFVAIKY